MIRWLKHKLMYRKWAKELKQQAFYRGSHIKNENGLRCRYCRLAYVDWHLQHCIIDKDK